MSLPNWKPEGYEIIRELGRGGMGVVYEATDLALGRRVAIKTFNAALANEPTFLARFDREARAAASLTHPGVVTIYSVGKDDYAHFIVMEFIEGASLAALIDERGRFDPEEAGEILIQACDALGAAHARGLIHRDIKPHNIMLTEEGRAKLTDFGLVALSEEASELSVTGEQMGTPHYMAPETCEGKRPTARTDIYSMGVVLYELLAGRHAINGASYADFVRIIIQEPFPDVADVRPDVPATLSAIIHKATARNPDERYTTCEELAKALRDALRAEQPKSDMLEAFQDSSSAEMTQVVSHQSDVALWFAEADTPTAKELAKGLRKAGLKISLVVADNESKTVHADIQQTRCLAPVFSKAFTATGAVNVYEDAVSGAECTKPIYLEPCESDDIIEQRRGFRWYGRGKEEAVTDLAEAIDDVLSGDDGLDFDDLGPAFTVAPGASVPTAQETPARLVRRIDNLAGRFRGGALSQPEYLEALNQALPEPGRCAYLRVTSPIDTCMARRLVVDYAEANELQLDVAWWIDAGSTVKAMAHLAELARALGLPAAESANIDKRSRSVGAWIQKSSHWLLVVGDAVAPESIAKVIPDDHKGRIVIITASDARPLPGDTIQFQPLSSAQMDQAMAGAREITEHWDPQRMREALGGQALSVHLATRYLVQTQGDADEYLAAIESKLKSGPFEELLESPSMGVLGAQVALTVEELAREEDRVANFLAACGLADGADIAASTLDLFAKVPDSTWADAFGDDVRMPTMDALARFGLIEMNRQSITIDPAIHRVLREWALGELAFTSGRGLKRLIASTRGPRIDPVERDAFIEGLLALASDIFEESSAPHNSWDAIAAQLPHLHMAASAAETLEIDPAGLARYWSGLARFFSRHGLLELGSGAYRNAIDCNEQDAESNRTKLVPLYLGLSRIHRQRGQESEAAEAFEHALHEWEAFPDEEKGYDYLAAQLDAAEYYLENGSKESAATCFDRASSCANSKSDGEDEMLRAKAFERLGRIGLRIGKPELATEYLNQSLESYRAAPGKPSPVEGELMRLLAGTHAKLNDYDRAVQLWRELHDFAKDHGAPGKTRAIKDLSEFAVAQWKAGDKTLAVENMSRAYAEARALHGENDRETGLLAYNLGSILQDSDELEKAEICFEQALNTFEATIGSEHRYTQTAKKSLTNLRESRMRREQRKEAMKQKFRESRSHPDNRES